MSLTEDGSVGSVHVVAGARGAVAAAVRAVSWSVGGRAWAWGPSIEVLVGRLVLRSVPLWRVRSEPLGRVLRLSVKEVSFVASTKVALIVTTIVSVVAPRDFVSVVAMVVVLKTHAR